MKEKYAITIQNYQLTELMCKTLEHFHCLYACKPASLTVVLRIRRNRSKIYLKQLAGIELTFVMLMLPKTTHRQTKTDIQKKHIQTHTHTPTHAPL